MLRGKLRKAVVVKAKEDAPRKEVAPRKDAPKKGETSLKDASKREASKNGKQSGE